MSGTQREPFSFADIIHPPHRRGVSSCWLNSVIIAQVSLRLDTIKGHSKNVQFYHTAQCRRFRKFWGSARLAWIFSAKEKCSLTQIYTDLWTIFERNRPFVYVEKVFDLWVLLMENGAQKQKCCAYNFVQCILQKKTFSLSHWILSQKPWYTFWAADKSSSGKRGQRMKNVIVKKGT